MAKPFSCPMEVVRHPDRVTAQIVASQEVCGLTAMTVLDSSRDRVEFLVGLEPLAVCAGYPSEVVRLTVSASRPASATPNDVFRPPSATPVDPFQRRWCHRNPGPDGRLETGELCLWYPRDPRALRWHWDDGLVEFILIVHRHLMAEEFARRHHGRWPVEAAPHGDGDHPIRSAALLRYLDEHAA